MQTQNKLRAVLFNGPPRSGKDTAADYVHSACVGLSGLWPFKFKFADPLKQAVHIAFGCPDTDAAAYEHEKDIPQDVFFGNTPRQMYISFAQRWVKQEFGQDAIAKMGVASILARVSEYAPATPTSLAIISDCGFQEESEQIARVLGPENVLICRLHRNGCDFKNDSRNYVTVEGAKTIDIHNTDFLTFGKEVFKIVNFWLNDFDATKPMYA